MRAVPKTYESLHAEDGTVVVDVLNDGSRSQSWTLVMDLGRGWTVYPARGSSMAAVEGSACCNFGCVPASRVDVSGTGGWVDQQ